MSSSTKKAKKSPVKKQKTQDQSKPQPITHLDGLADAHHEINERDVEIEHLKTTLIAVNQKVTVSTPPYLSYFRSSTRSKLTS
jgi:hypothetical protein